MGFVLRWEGGFSKNPDDPGNWTGGVVGVGELKGTNWGISAAAFPHLDIENLTLEDARAIYRSGYWEPLNLDDYSPEYAMVVFDSAVQHGVNRARAWMGEHPTVESYLLNRMNFYTNLRDFGTFGRGWMRRMHALMHEVLRPKSELAGVKRAYLVLWGGLTIQIPYEKASVVGDKLYVRVS